MRILNVAYPFAPVGPNAVGGAEQVLSRIDEALVRVGQTSVVLGCKGSQVFGTLIEAFTIPEEISKQFREQAYLEYRTIIESAAREFQVDLIHMHGVDFHEYIPRTGIPILATLHLPPSWYPQSVYSDERIWMHCVSESQQANAPYSERMLPPIPNGVEIPECLTHSRKKFCFALGRICPEKGFHIAFDAARQAHLPCFLGGEVFPYPEHQAYFKKEILTRMDRYRRYVGPLDAQKKKRYYASGQCLLAPSQVAETSSLVAMEALAHGLPVIAFNQGALPTLVEHGLTGFIVNTAEEMRDAILSSGGFSHAACRESARARFSLEGMITRYFERYEQLLDGYSVSPELCVA
jgi:glycosyltransferase involved in cell wall biosynthesis